MELKPCPFCGNTRLFVNWNTDGEGDITCVCGAKMTARTVREHYEQVAGDLYRKIPSVSGKDAVREKWNRRADNG
jgi:hypothetical protein